MWLIISVNEKGETVGKNAMAESEEAMSFVFSERARGFAVIFRWHGDPDEHSLGLGSD